MYVHVVKNRYILDCSKEDCCVYCSISVINKIQILLIEPKLQYCATKRAC